LRTAYRVFLKIDETGDNPPGSCSDKTLWTPAAFKKEYDELADQVQEIGAKNVYVATVPHVTILVGLTLKHTMGDIFAADRRIYIIGFNWCLLLGC
jgi:hypothetical protein